MAYLTCQNFAGFITNNDFETDRTNDPDTRLLKISVYIELPMWYHPHAQDFKNVNISWVSIGFTTNPLYCIRKPKDRSHYNASQVMMNRVT